jgi:uncharacterized protein YkwD
MAAAGVVVLSVPGVAHASCSAARARPSSVSLKAVRHATLCLLNHERRRHHLRPLRENRTLDRASRRHSRAMARKNFFEHGDFAARIRRAGYHGYTLGENIAWGSLSYSTPKSIVRLWMHSPGHRANILRPQFTQIGIGIARGAPERGVHGAAVYTTDFGRPA